MNRLSADVVVVGSGIAGLSAALRAKSETQVVIVTKGKLEEGNTRYAQGGIAAAWFPDDSPTLHESDTSEAGDGLCDPAALRIMCEEAASRIADLLSYGVPFDQEGPGFARGLEAAHSVARILHAGGDSTGAFIESALVRAVHDATIPCRERSFVTDLIVSKGRVVGLRLLDEDGAPTEVSANAVVLASGGAGQVFLHTTNPTVATGDGVAAAHRAGAEIADMEFFQFHPTALAMPGTAPFLISEAVRGEGAFLLDRDGRHFLLDVHPQAELAPRDVLARAIVAQVASQDGEPVVLDVTHLGSTRLRSRFPRIDAHCRALGLDWAREPIPVTPAAHYSMGGIVTDTFGRTSLRGLYACGEVACTGVHGANRLASNSLLEGIVFGVRVGASLSKGDKAWDKSDTLVGSLRATLPPVAPGLPGFETGALLDPALEPGSERSPATSLREAIRTLTWAKVGLIRDGSGLSEAAARLAAWEATLPEPTGISDLEDANLLRVARLVTEAALLREESRGAHFRSDFPMSSPAWERHIVFEPPTAPNPAASADKTESRLAVP
jgi:L-aspartate oxidase